MRVILPVLPNIFPFNELLFNRRLSAKTREWKWNYVGPVLLYTSRSRIAREVAEAHKLNPSDFCLGAIVGIGWLLPVRPNTPKEMFRIEKEFGNGKKALPWVAAYYRYEFTNLKKFKNPVLFKPPRGAVRTFLAPTTLVAKALKEIGIDPKTLAH